MVEQKQREPGQEPDGRERRQASAPRGIVARILSDGSLTKKASLTAAAYAIDNVARIVVKLVITPFLLRTLGDTLFGIFTVLRSLIDQTAPASGRPGEALKWTVAHEQSSTDFHRKRQHVGNAVAVWLLFLPFMLLLGGVLAWFAPQWLDVATTSYATVRLAGALLVVDLVLASLAYLPQAALQGENLGYKRLGLSTTIVVAGGVLMTGAVALGGGIVGLAIAVVLQTALAGVIYLHIARTRVPWFGVAKPDRAGVRAFAGLSWWFLVWNVVMRLLQASDVVLLGIAGSPALVTTYAVTKYVPQATTVAVAMMIFSIMPGLGGLVGSGDLRRAAGIRHETMTMIWLMTVVAGATTLVWEESFLALWVGPEYYPGNLTMLAIVVMVLQFALIRTDANIIDLTLTISRKVMLGAFAAALSIGLGWLLLGPLDLGILGLVVGFVAGRFVLSVGYPLMLGRMLAIPLGHQLRGIVRPGLVTIVLLGGATALADVVHAGTWLVLIVGSAASGLAIAAVAYFGGLGADARGRAWRRIRKVARLT
jgi:O-antigen/teichoic acid export membrane protein